MARIRSLKPEFFTSEQVVGVSIPARMLFQGMWVHGDDDGYCAPSPVQLKMRVFPADSVDVPALLDELIEADLVRRVDTDQGEALWVPSFLKHQSPKYPTPTKYTRDGASLTQHSPRTGGAVGKSSGSIPPGEERRGEERSREEKSSSSEVADAPIRPDIVHLLDLLDSEIERNGASKPTRSKKNIDAARLLLDRDGKSVAQVEAAIRWAQGDEFWRSNILSMSKLREKYDTLALAAKKAKPGGNVTPMRRDIPKSEEWMYR